MEEVNINYAYDGFLYAPMFLADALGVFQKRMKTRYRDGDEPTVDKLRTPVDPDDHGKNWFAICDPFAKDITAVQQAIGARDQVCIIGSFIHRLPVWLYYSGGAELDLCGDENRLEHQRPNVDFIRCYKHFNTGYLVGEHVRSKLQLGPEKLLERNFGAEFGDSSDILLPKTLVATSDVLQLIRKNAFNSGSVVLSYAQRVPHLNPFLFTAVLTLKSVIDRRLDAVLSVLSGLRMAARHIGDENNIQKLREHFADFSLDEVRQAVDVLQCEEIYSTEFDLDEAAKSYENARAAWQKVKPSLRFPDIEKCREPIPCLLLKNGWNTDKTLVDLFVKGWRGNPQLLEILARELPKQPGPFKRKYQAALAVVLAVLTFVSSYMLVKGWYTTTTKQYPLFWVIAALFCLIQLISSVVLAWNLVKRRELKGAEFLGGTVFGAFGILATIITWILK